MLFVPTFAYRFGLGFRLGFELGLGLGLRLGLKVTVIFLGFQNFCINGTFAKPLPSNKFNLVNQGLNIGRGCCYLRIRKSLSLLYPQP